MPKEHRWYHKPYYTNVSYKKLMAVAFLVLGLVCMLGSIAGVLQWSYNKGVPVRQEYTNYICSAAEMYDPLLIVQTLERALEGIENLGLKPTDSGAAFSWNVNYHYTVEFNIDQIKSAIDYGNNVIEWKQQSYQGMVVENVNDVYTEKVAHLRDVAGDPDIGNIEVAYCFNHKPELFWYPYMSCIFYISILITALGLLLTLVWVCD